MRFVHSRSSLPVNLTGFSLAALTLLVGALLLWADAHPLRLAAPVPSFVPRPSKASPVALVLVPSPAPRPDRFSKRDASFAWVGWLEQTLGPVAWARSFPDTSDPGRLLVFTHGYLDQAPPDPDRLRSFVEAGGALILDRPGPALAPLSGVTLDTSANPSGKLTASSLPWFDRAAPLFSRLPLPTRHQGIQAQAPDLEALLSVNGAPALLLRHLGRGVVVTTAFDLAGVIQSIQQGTPGDDWKVTNRYPNRLSWPLETSDLVIDESLLDADFPVADWLEQALFARIAEEIFLPSWWAYPGGAAGALIITHDEEGMGDRAAWMGEAERAQGVVSTQFLVPSEALSSEGISRFVGGGLEAALHVIVPPETGDLYPGSGYGVEGRFRPLGFWKLTPFLKVLPARDQLNYLRHIQPAVPIAPLSRTHFLAWPPGFDVLFRQLPDAGIALDSSYGPDKDTRGYLFGTARPFRPLSDTGLPFDLLELPFCSAENLGGADLAYFEQAFRLSEEGAHQVISPLFHPNSFAWHPDMRNYATWKDLPELAQSASHRLMTLGGLLEFEQARQSSALSVLDESSTLRLKVLPLHVDLQLRVPAVWRQRPLAEVEGAADFSCAHWDMGSRVCLVRLLPGETELTLKYGPTPASPSP